MNLQGMMKYVNKRNVIIAIIVAVVLIIISVINSSSKQQGSYLLEKAVSGTVYKRVSETGTVESNQNINLSFKSSGRIEGIYVKVGEEVKTGQELAKLDTTSLSIQLRQAEADYAIMQAKSTDAGVSFESAAKNLKNVEVSSEASIENAYDDAVAVLSDCGSRINNAYNIAYEMQQTYFVYYQGDSGTFIDAKNTIKESLDKINVINAGLRSNPSRQNIDTAISEAEKLLKNVKSAIDSARGVAGSVGFRTLVSSTDLTNLDTQKTYINTAYTSLVDAEQAISTAKASGETAINTAKSEVLLLEKQLGGSSDSLYLLQLEQSRNQVSLLRNQISEAIIKSPIDGKITAVSKKAGEIVNPTDSFISMLSLGLFQVKVNIYEGDIMEVREGNPVEITLVAMPDYPLRGAVISVNPAEKVINEVVYYEVTIGFIDFKEGIKQGMTADIVIESGKKENVLMVPRRAIEKINGERRVKVSKKGKIEERKIEIGLEGDDYVEIVSGLSAGEEVVIGKKI